MFLIQNRPRCRELGFDNKIEKWLKHELRQTIASDKEHETAWYLYFAGVFRFKLGPDDLKPSSSIPNPVVFSLIGLLREYNLVSIPLSNWEWRAYIKKNGLVNGEYWLPLYEAVLRGWTKDRKIIKAVNASPLMNKLLSSRVSFLDETLLNLAQKLNLSSTSSNALLAIPGDAQTDNEALPAGQEEELGHAQTEANQAELDTDTEGEAVKQEQQTTEKFKNLVKKLRKSRETRLSYDD